MPKNTKKPKKKKKKKEKLDIGQFKVDSKHVIPPFKLQNVVSTFSLGVSGLDLKEIALKHSFLEFNPQTFAAGTLRLVHPRTTALAFASGNMVCTGGKTELDSRYAARKYSRIFQKIGIPVCFKDFKIQNIVASAEVGFNLKLQEIADKFGPYTTYEADLFPGLILRSINPKLVFLCFRSGKIVITGAKNKQQIEQTYKALYTNIIVHFRDSETSTASSSAYRNQIKNARDLSGL